MAKGVNRLWQYIRAEGKTTQESIVAYDTENKAMKFENDLEMLDQLGENGWELISVVVDRWRVLYYFKRQLPN